MRINDQHMLESEPDDGIRVVHDFRASGTVIIKPSKLCLAATQFKPIKSQEDAVNWFGRNRHIIISQDGRKVYQLAPLNIAQQVNPFIGIKPDREIITIALDNPGDLSTRNNTFNFRDLFLPGQYLQAVARKDTKVKDWVLFSDAQLDTLCLVAGLIVKKYGLLEVIEVGDLIFNFNPGPAFPLTRFKAEVFSKKVMLERIHPPSIPGAERPVFLTSAPGFDQPRVFNRDIPADTRISVQREEDDWSLVEVMDALDSKKWLIGWVESRAVQGRSFRPVVFKDHQLGSFDGSRVPFIVPPPSNFDPRRKIIQHKYILLHITGNTRLQGTIDHFMNPASGVSVHLLIGRDGRVVQFVPFDKAAWHAGDSYWEGDVNLNNYSIGIELDNAGFLEKFEDGYYKRINKRMQKVTDVEETKHWKEFRSPGWQKFPEVQLAILTEIVEALKNTYGIITVLGHDDVNLARRLDPGPLFPIENLREQVFGMRFAEVEMFETTRQTAMYEKVGTKVEGEKFTYTAYRPPDLDYPAFSWPLLANSTVFPEEQILNDHERPAWYFCKIGQTAIEQLWGKRGWVAANDVDSNQKTRVATRLYQRKPKKLDWFEPPPLREAVLDEGTRVRIQTIDASKRWALVATMQPVGFIPCMEGWVETALLRKLGKSKWRAEGDAHG